MLDNPSLHEPSFGHLRPNDEVAGRGTASWFIPPVIIPILLLGSAFANGLYRLVHFGPAAFN